MRKKELDEILQGKPAVILIDDKIEGATYLPWHSLLPFQGELKELSKEGEKKMLLSLIDKGFFDIKKVWRKSINEVYIADGHQTITTLSNFKPEIESGQIKLLRKSDNKPTDLIPCIFINADDEDDLAAKLLLINSEYGTVTPHGLQSFKERFGISDAFMSNVAAFSQWKPTITDWQSPKSVEWEMPKTDSFTSLPPQPINQLPTQESEPIEESSLTESIAEQPKVEYIEYPIILKKADYDLLVEVVKRVKKDCMFDKNSDAIMHIIKQYETYVGNI